MDYILLFCVSVNYGLGTAVNFAAYAMLSDVFLVTICFSID